MKGRKPRPDELSLWEQVNTKTEVFQKRTALQDRPAPPAAKPRPTFETLPKQTMQTWLKTEVSLAPSLNDTFARQKPVMDHKTFTHLRRGNLRPEAKLDLHGMTMDRAHAALTRFVMSAHGSGKRLILVVTGKGKARDDGGPIPVRLGVLRHQVPQWLALPPLAGVVLEVTQAHQRHGGTGAYYVYLRRAR